MDGPERRLLVHRMAPMFARLTALAAAALVACGPTGPAADSDPRPQTPHPLVFPRQLIQVVARDAIPSVDDPKFVVASEVDWLVRREPVMALEIEGDARAYPLQILTWHEIVNDVVGGHPVVVTYCPLCNSGVVFGRRADGRTLDFGTSGKLFRSSLVMYDRQTGSLWTHFDGRAVRGPLTGTKLDPVPAQILSFGQWRSEHSEGRVLSRDTGVSRDYGKNPYDFYDSQDGPIPEFFPGGWDRRLPALARVVGVAFGDVAVAYPYGRLSSPTGTGIIQDSVGGQGIVVFWQAGVASALDKPVIANARDVGSSGVFEPAAAGRNLTFLIRGGQIFDEQTGSTWNLAGRAITGPLKGERLESVHHLDSFWFAWQAFYPETLIHGMD
jgi:hypothetical protein